MQFYRYERSDFIEIPATCLRVGDHVSLYDSHGRYGALPVQEVTDNGEQIILDVFVLPGADMESTEGCGIRVSWRGKEPAIVATLYKRRDQRVVVLPR